MFRWIAATLIALAMTVDEARSATLDGVYNTGPSDSDENENATLDVEFGPCADQAERLCGVIVAAHDPDDPDRRDVLPDGSPVIGFAMVRGLKDKGDGEYRGGEINAIDESLKKGEMIWYGVKIDALPGGDLEVRGCLAFICPRTMVWKRISARS